MKISIARHKEGLSNMRAFAQRLREEAKRKADDAARVERDCIELDAQIIEAELRGVDGFDSERFGKKRSA